MAADYIQLYGRAAGIGSMVSDERAGTVAEQLDVLCGVHLQLDGDEVELRVRGSGMHDQLLAAAEDQLRCVEGFENETCKMPDESCEPLINLKLRGVVATDRPRLTAGVSAK